MPQIRIAGPTGEPLDMLAAKLHMRVTDSSLDSAIADDISTAREKAEQLTKRQLLHARFVYTTDGFVGERVGTPYAYTARGGIPPNSIVLLRSPVCRVVSIDYDDMQGATQIVDPSIYVVSSVASAPGFVALAFGKFWPIPLPQPNCVRVTYDAGYASPIAVDAGASEFTTPGPFEWNVGDVVRFSNSGGALPSPLASARDFYIVAAAGNTYGVATTKGGDPLVFDDVGSGTSLIGEVPPNLIKWIKMRTATQFGNSEEVAVLNRGSIQDLQFAPGLLDEFKDLVD